MGNDMLRYGKYQSDTNIEAAEGLYRIRIIDYDGKLYRHTMFNGNVLSIDTIKK